MRRSTRRRFIVALALLSHLVTAFFVHVPMAYASLSATAQPAVSQPCPEHMKMMNHASDAGQANDHCKSGPCKCPCAHAQALAVVPMLAPALVAHSPSVIPYRVPPAPDCATSFFRPPI